VATELAELTFQLPGGVQHTFRDDSGQSGDPGVRDVVVELTADAWDDFRAERRSAFGLLYAGMLTMMRGSFEDLVAWEPRLRQQWDDRPVYDDTAIAAVAGIDLHRTFTLDDTDADLRAFLEATGFLHIRGVFTPDEVARMGQEVERLRAQAVPDDGRSWFAKNRAGEQVCCRVIYCAQLSDVLAPLPYDPRLTRLAALCAQPLRPTDDRIDGLMAVIKNPDVVEGLSDLPWHQDCGLGGHPVLCPALNIGIQLDPANAGNGQLRYLAGSHFHSIPNGGAIGPEESLPIVAVDTQPGDLTVHYGHVLHEAPPPTDPAAGRRVLYVMYATERLFEAIPAGKGGNDVLLDTPGQPAPTALV
jgi:hypothetical protein